MSGSSCKSTTLLEDGLIIPFTSRISNLLPGEFVIERVPHAKPYPKCAFLGYLEPKGEALHVVCSITPRAAGVTVYFPDEDSWAQAGIRKI